MKLIDIETGIEYTLPSVKAPYIIATGKTYEKREGYAWFDSMNTDGIDSYKNKDITSTHKTITFLEPIEKVEPMPEILPGDVIGHVSGAPSYVFADESRNEWARKNVLEIYRNGVKIWQRDIE